jgi:hypothetical protein
LSVPDSRIRAAARYRTQVAECRQLADIASDENLRAEYTRAAQHYLSLAEAEEKLAAANADEHRLGY